MPSGYSTQDILQLNDAVTMKSDIIEISPVGESVIIAANVVMFPFSMVLCSKKDI